MFITLILRIFLTISVCLISVSHTWAMPRFSINGSDNVFTIQGEGLEGVGGLDLAVDYDPATLTNPRVALQELFIGAMMQAKTTVAGRARIVILANRPGVSGSGGVAMITFDQVGKNKGYITSFSANAVSSTGETLAPQASNLSSDNSTPPETNPPSPIITSPTRQTPDIRNDIATTPGTAVASTTVLGSNISTGTTGAPYVIGAVSMQDSTIGGRPEIAPQDSGTSLPVQNSTESRHQGDQPSLILVVADVLQGGESPKEYIVHLDVATQQPVNGKHQSAPEYKSVLSFFKEFKGTRSNKRLLALFANAAYPDLKQIPEIVIADGKSTVKISVASIPTAHAPSFIINGGELVSLSSGPDTYIFEILPKRNALDVSVTIVVKNDVIVIPLTVAPPLDVRFLHNGQLDKKSFGLFLHEKNIKKSDINGDGVKDYIDEYIYAANYLTRYPHGSAGKKDQKADKQSHSANHSPS